MYENPQIDLPGIRVPVTTSIMKKFINPLLIVGVLVLGIGYYMYNKPVESLEKKRPDVEIAADQLITEYEADEKAANDKYLGKVVQVSGKVSDITTEEGKMKVQLETSNPMSLIICELEDGSDPGAIKAGDEVKMKGLCSGYLSDVILVQSTVVK